MTMVSSLCAGISPLKAPGGHSSLLVVREAERHLHFKGCISKCSLNDLQ